MPDIFVPSDTTYVSAFYNKSISLLYSFAFQYSDNHRETVSSFKDFKSLQRYLAGQGLLNAFISYATPRIGRPTPAELKRSGAEMERLIIAYIMRQCKDENFFYQEFNSSDKTYLKGLSLFNE